jgi:biopolymer transport protein ExbB
MLNAALHHAADLLNFLAKGGVLMLPIVLISVITVALFIERLWYYRRARCDAAGVYAQIEALVKSRRFDEAIAWCGRYQQAIVPEVLKCVLQNRRRPAADVEKLVSVVGTRKIQTLSRYVRFIGILGNLAPLIGLLGTVVGMVKTFMKIADLSGNVNPSILAGGIWEALLTTAAGLAVAIPTIMIYHYFEQTIDRFAFQMKNYSLELIELLHEYD